MARKRNVQPQVFTGYERFVYLLTELEFVVASGTVEWTPASATMARDRVDRIAAALHQLEFAIKNRQSVRRPI
jgi:hypothetical protein